MGLPIAIAIQREKVIDSAVFNCYNVGVVVASCALPSGVHLQRDGARVSQRPENVQKREDSIMDEQKMPSSGGCLAMLIVGFALGIIWGALSISPYKKVKAAIANGDVATAQENAKKIRMFMIIGIVVNVLFFIIQLA